MKETEDEKKSVQSFGFQKIGWRVELMEQGGDEENGKGMFLSCEYDIGIGIQLDRCITKHQIPQG